MKGLFISAIIFAAIAFGQKPSASVAGRITDASGQPIPKAGLTLRGSPGTV
jgi:hypothetical protein